MKAKLTVLIFLLQLLTSCKPVTNKTPVSIPTSNSNTTNLNNKMMIDGNGSIQSSDIAPNGCYISLALAGSVMTTADTKTLTANCTQGTNLNYQWKDSNSVSISNSPSLILSNLSLGIKNFTVIISNSISSQTLNQTLTVNIPVSVKIPVTTPLTNAPNSVPSQIVCDGHTDMTKTIQSEINNSVGNQFILPASSGACIVTGLNIPSNSHITINGQLILAANANNSVITINRNNNIIIDGSGIIDGNRNQNPPCTAPLGCAGVNAYNATNITVGGTSGTLTIQNAKMWPVNIVLTNGSVMQNLRLLNSGNSVEFAMGTHNCLATNITISGIDDEGFAFYGGVYDCTIQNSDISNSLDGVSILNDGDQSEEVHDVNIINVESHDNNASGIGIDQGIGGNGRNHRNIKISNCNLHGNNRSNSFPGVGIRNISGNNVQISQVHIHDDNGSTITNGLVSSEIYQSPTVNGSVIDNVTIDNVRNGNGIWIDRASNITVTNTHSSQSSSLVYGITGTPGPGFGQYCNKFEKTSVAPIFFNNSTPITPSNQSCDSTVTISALLDNTPIGIIDNVTTSSINGWACAKNSSASITVHLYVGGAAGTGTIIGAYNANLISEPNVATACHSTGSAYRFSIPLTDTIKNQYGGKNVYIYGINSSSSGALNTLLTNSGTLTIPQTKVTAQATAPLSIAAPIVADPYDYTPLGYIDSVTTSSISGWACAKNSATSITVHLYVGGVAGAGTIVGAYNANLTSEPMLSSVCNSSGSNYRFSIPMTDSLQTQYGGKLIYVYGINPNSSGATNALLTNSGVMSIPQTKVSAPKNVAIAPIALCTPKEYYSQRPDVASAKIIAITHYNYYGKNEGACNPILPQCTITSAIYLAQRPDVAKAGVSAITHYNSFGQFEGMCQPY